MSRWFAHTDWGFATELCMIVLWVAGTLVEVTSALDRMGRVERTRPVEVRVRRNPKRAGYGWHSDAPQWSAVGGPR